MYDERVGEASTDQENQESLSEQLETLCLALACAAVALCFPIHSHVWSDAGFQGLQHPQRNSGQPLGWAQILQAVLLHKHRLDIGKEHADSQP